MGCSESFDDVMAAAFADLPVQVRQNGTAVSDALATVVKCGSKLTFL